MAGDLEAIAQQRQRWSDAVNARDVDRYLDLLTDDIVWLPPEQPALTGKEAFAAWVRPFFERFDYDFVVEASEVRPAGDWAVERGVFQTMMTSLDDGKTGRHAGAYIVLWRRDPGSNWLIERYIDETQSQALT